MTSEIEKRFLKGLENLGKDKILDDLVTELVVTSPDEVQRVRENIMSADMPDDHRNELLNKLDELNKSIH